MTKTILSQKADHLPTPPHAPQHPTLVTHHDIAVTDEYAWLRDSGYPKVETPEILDYLKAENAYYEAAMAPVADLTDTIFKELKGRVAEEDESVHPAMAIGFINGALRQERNIAAGTANRQRMMLRTGI